MRQKLAVKFADFFQSCPSTARPWHCRDGPALFLIFANRPRFFFISSGSRGHTRCQNGTVKRRRFVIRFPVLVTDGAELIPPNINRQHLFPDAKMTLPSRPGCLSLSVRHLFLDASRDVRGIFPFTVSVYPNGPKMALVRRRIRHARQCTAGS